MPSSENLQKCDKCISSPEGATRFPTNLSNVIFVHRGRYIRIHYPCQDVSIDLNCDLLADHSHTATLLKVLSAWELWPAFRKVIPRHPSVKASKECLQTVFMESAIQGPGNGWKWKNATEHSVKATLMSALRRSTYL